MAHVSNSGGPPPLSSSSAQQSLLVPQPTTKSPKVKTKTKVIQPPPSRPLMPLTRRSSSMRRRLSILDITRLTICMLGVQFTWTVELGYGTPYLLSLGIPKSMTALVWLAGPLSGLIIQPTVGVFSDVLDWKMGRRRPFILIGAVFTVFSMYMVAFAHELALKVVGNGVETDAAYQSA
ncbi:hypothetical protein BGZ65_011295, partial [Modicella reniformis]